MTTLLVHLLPPPLLSLSEKAKGSNFNEIGCKQRHRMLYFLYFFAGARNELSDFTKNKSVSKIANWPGLFKKHYMNSVRNVTYRSRAL